MVNIFRRYYINRTFLYIALTCFVVTYSFPLNANQQIAIGFNDVAFMVKLERLVEKLLKSTKSTPSKIIDCLIDVKLEIEFAYNMQISIDKCMHELSKEFVKHGIKFPKNQFDTIKKMIKHKDKKAKKSYYKYKDVEEDDEIPSLLVYGVTTALCGFFLMCVPIPACKEWGARLLVAGVTAAANSLCSANDRNKEAEKNRYKYEIG